MIKQHTDFDPISQGSLATIRIRTAANNKGISTRCGTYLRAERTKKRASNRKPHSEWRLRLIRVVCQMSDILQIRTPSPAIPIQACGLAALKFQASKPVRLWPSNFTASFHPQNVWGGIWLSMKRVCPMSLNGTTDMGHTKFDNAGAVLSGFGLGQPLAAYVTPRARRVSPDSQTVAAHISPSFRSACAVAGRVHPSR